MKFSQRSLVTKSARPHPSGKVGVAIKPDGRLECGDVIGHVAKSGPPSWRAILNIIEKREFKMSKRKNIKVQKTSIGNELINEIIKNEFFSGKEIKINDNPSEKSEKMSRIILDFAAPLLDECETDKERERIIPRSIATSFHFVVCGLVAICHGWA